MYKKFDWVYCKKNTNPLKYNYFKNYWDKWISEDKFVKDWQMFRRFSLLHDKKDIPFAYTARKLSKSYSPSRIRKTYRYLRNRFGFFIGNTNEHGE